MAVATRKMAFRGQKRVEAQPKTVLHKVRDQPAQQRTVYLEARVRVKFDEPSSELTINHKIQPKNLKIAIFSVRIYF